MDLTYIHRFSKPWNLRVDAYRHEVRASCSRTTRTCSTRSSCSPKRSRIAFSSRRKEPDLNGLELSVSGAAGAPLQWLANYTWSSAMDRIDGADVPRSWDQTHAGNVLVAYRWRPGWFLSVGGTIHTGWPTTPVTGRVVTLPDGGTEIEEVVGPRNSARYPTYARLDVKTGRAIATVKGSVRVELAISNLTNRQNVCCIDEIRFEAAPDGSVTSSSELKYWLGITPSLPSLVELLAPLFFSSARSAAIADIVPTSLRPACFSDHLGHRLLAELDPFLDEGEVDRRRGRARRPTPRCDPGS